MSYDCTPEGLVIEVCTTPNADPDLAQVRLSDLPDKAPRVDEIARLLQGGATPKEKRPDPRSTGSTTPRR